jgi:hypothetical protein
MTNPIALVLLILVLGSFAVDWLYFGLEGSLFLARRLYALIEYLAFWR